MRQHEDKQMHALYEQWLSSGQSKAIFAQEHGLPTSTFYYWASKFGKQALTSLGPEQQGGFWVSPDLV
ncbi:hypothetical protein BH24BAC1_BH24BAC1_22400 [soil metagenome]